MRMLDRILGIQLASVNGMFDTLINKIRGKAMKAKYTRYIDHSTKTYSISWACNGKIGYTRYASEYELQAVWSKLPTA